MWNYQVDTINISKREINVEANTKRSILQTIATIFDPLGWSSPLTIRGRIFTQDLWKLKLGWDEVLPIELQHEWKNIAKDLANFFFHST